MVIMVLNTGSSSIKFTCFDLKSGEPELLARGLVERIGLPGAAVQFARHPEGPRLERKIEAKSTLEAVNFVAGLLTSAEYGVVKSLDEVQVIGHRVAHGLDRITGPVLVDEEVKQLIRDGFPLAPLHNPVHLAGIEACEEIFPGVPNTAVFDTAFHATMPLEAFLYAIPYDLYTEHRLRRYSFHGTSCAYVLPRALALADLPAAARVIICHLGGGATVTAIAGGRSQENSGGLTTLEGPVMGTRCGNIDPGALLHIQQAKGFQTAEELENFLNKECGVLGLAGIGSSDLRDVEKAAAEGHERCRETLAVYARRIKKYVGSYMAVLGGVDLLVFTAGIGQNSAGLRRRICAGLEGLGFLLDEAKNNGRFTEAGMISRVDSPVKIAVVPTDEEREIAIQTFGLIGGGTSV